MQKLETGCKAKIFKILRRHVYSMNVKKPNQQKRESLIFLTMHSCTERRVTPCNEVYTRTHTGFYVYVCLRVGYMGLYKIPLRLWIYGSVSP